MEHLRQSRNMGPQFSLLSITRALWKRKLFIFVVGLMGSAASFAVVSRMPAIYSAKAVILVESQKIPETFVAATVQTALEAQLDTLKQQVLSGDRLWGLVETLDLYMPERSKNTKEEVLGLMRQDIAISLSRGWSARGPGAFQVEYQAGKPSVAAEVANRIGMFFINENLRQRTAEALATSEFLEGQLAAAENRLREQEAKLKEFKLTHNGELPQQEAALLSSVAQSRTELLGIQDGLGRAQQNKLTLESSLAYAQASLRQRQEQAQRRAASGQSTAPDATPPAQQTALEEAQSALSLLRARYYNSHYLVQRMVQEVERLQREEAARAAKAQLAHPIASAAAASGAVPDRPPVPAAEELAGVEANRIQELGAQLSVVTQENQNLEQRRKRILQEVADVQARIRNLPVREQQLAVLNRDYETTKINYQSLLNKKLAADVAADMERWQKSQKFVMLDPARVPLKPKRPRRGLLTGAGSTLSVAFGAGLAFLLELKKDALLGEWELPSLTVILGRIPPIRMERL